MADNFKTTEKKKVYGWVKQDLILKCQIISAHINQVSECRW